MPVREAMGGHSASEEDPSPLTCNCNRGETAGGFDAGSSTEPGTDPYTRDLC